MLHTFTVPVKPHVRKFLLHHLGESYKLSRLDTFGRELKTLLEQKKTNNFLNGYTRCYTQVFGVSVEGNLILQKRLKALNSKEIIDFNNFVEDVIKTMAVVEAAYASSDGTPGAPNAAAPAVAAATGDKR